MIEREETEELKETRFLPPPRYFISVGPLGEIEEKERNFCNECKIGGEAVVEVRRDGMGEAGKGTGRTGLDATRPLLFLLLSNRLCGFTWKAKENKRKGEICHSQPFSLSLSCLKRYGGGGRGGGGRRDQHLRFRAREYARQMNPWGEGGKLGRNKKEGRERTEEGRLATVTISVAPCLRRKRGKKATMKKRRRTRSLFSFHIARTPWLQPSMEKPPPLPLSASADG